MVLLSDVLNNAVQAADRLIEENNAELINREQVARDVGVGGGLFHDLKHHRMTNVEFSLEEMLKFEGETGPYIQYTHARARSLLRKGGEGDVGVPPMDDFSWEVVKYLEAFSGTIGSAFERRDPSRLCRYLLDLCQAFNRFYAHIRILEENSGKPGRLALTEATALVLQEGLRLLGIKTPEEI